MGNGENQVLTTEHLNRTLGKKELYAIAFGHIVGAGIFALIGIGIGMTGTSLFIAILLSSVFIIAQAWPLMIISGTARFRGGMYSIMSKLWNSKLAGFYIIIFSVSNISLAMYAVSFAEYLQGIIAGAPIIPVALICLTVFFIVNILGIEGAAKLQIIMDIILALALTLFIVFGLPQVDIDTLFTEDFMTAGPVGLLTCAVLLTWATAGGIDMINLSAEAKNPKKDIPQVIIVVTLGVSIFYALIALVSAGVLPVELTADQPLTLVAAHIFPKPLYLFFVLAGALLALTTTLNASFAWVTKPILQACNDGWFPKKMGYLHPKFKTPVIILSIFYVIGLIPIVFGLDIETIAFSAVILSNILFVLICFGAINLPKKLPEFWSKSKFRCSKGMLTLAAVIGALASATTCVLLLMDAAPIHVICIAAVTVIGVVYAVIRYKTGKVDIQESVEEA